MKNTFLIFLTCFLFVSFSTLTHANYTYGAMADTKAAKQQKPLKVSNSSQAAKIVKNRTGGKVLKVQNSGKSGYKVKVMKKNGHIVSLKVDAKSGKIKGK